MGAFIERAKMLLANETTISGLVAVQKATCNLGCKMGRCNGQDCGKCPILQQYLLQFSAIEELHPDKVFRNTCLIDNEAVDFNIDDVVLKPNKHSAETELMQTMVDAINTSKSVEDYRKYANVLAERNALIGNRKWFAEWFISGIIDEILPSDCQYYCDGEQIVYYQPSDIPGKLRKTVLDWAAGVQNSIIVDESEVESC